MTVYVDHTPTGTEVGRDIIWARLWADAEAEGGDFAARLGVAWPAGARSTVIAERTRRRAILMGAIPVQTIPCPRGASGDGQLTAPRTEVAS